MEKLVCYFFCFFVEAIILWQYSSCLFIAKHKFRIRLILLYVLYLILFFVSLFDISWLNALLYFVANFIFLITQYKIKCLPTLFHAAIIEAIMGMCELLVHASISRFTPQFLQREDFHSRLSFALFSKTAFFTITYILIYFIKRRQKYMQQNDKSIFLLLIIPITSVFAMHTFVSVSENSALSPTLNWMITLSSVFLLASNLLVFGINQYTQKKNLEFTEMQLLLQKESDSAEYYKMLVTQHENQSILIHDIKKHLQSIDLLNEQKEHDKIRSYIQQLLLSSDLKEISRMCDHDLLNAVLSRYKRQCDNNHIAFHVDIRSKTTQFIEDNDLTSLFCNLLDNSIEAAKGISNSFIELTTKKVEHSPYVVVSIINTCSENPFTGHGDNLITSKSDKTKHGFGLKSIRKIVSKYQGEMQQYFDDETLTFHTIITLKYN